jgi:hypothetical protein
MILVLKRHAWDACIQGFYFGTVGPPPAPGIATHPYVHKHLIHVNAVLIMHKSAKCYSLLTLISNIYAKLSENVRQCA